jgi:uncharacterized protein
VGLFKRSIRPEANVEKSRAIKTKKGWMMTGKSSIERRQPDDGTLRDLVRRIVESVKPRRIILFGSAVRGGMGPDSDLDLLVVMPDGSHRRRTTQAIYRNLSGLGVAKDVVVVTESDVREHGENPSLVLCPALQHGRELYHAPG